MNINASARNILISSGGVLERTFFTGRYSIELCSKIYKNWVFPNQALPKDLILGGMAVEDSNSPHGLRLTIEDYPYAVDGLEIWSAIKTWVQDYCTFYYKNDGMVQNDTELQSCKLKEIEERMVKMNKDESLKNRHGPVKVPYTLLYPSSKEGLTGVYMKLLCLMLVYLPY
ncbi:hypothetical protein L1987_85650 [Smallanthus sonchifolius]|uniref:Uncharacterized protein n=1 Tax=Smallanthus sonchifolius TaxID=185202 RepID=A0ACB8XYQ8_9ASTR|nr:hypothetical protein L1987_85650 [Smallanthus sonchifolius]